jgi:uncharacterized protein YyaL (SSP411 family)
MNKHSNRLAAETSPYLRQHAHNPVDWYPWGDEALARARDENKPILLSIGYAACHWCHVMERESFEDERVASFMNEHFVCIKVDREERPDLDAIYMQATQLMSGHGGWPMTVFLTPQCVPYFAGTYFPPHGRHGLPSFSQVLTAMAEAWNDRRHDVEENARKMKAALESLASQEDTEHDVDTAVLDKAFRGIGSRFEPRDGGFGGAPKFPQAMTMAFLLRQYRRTGSAEALRMVTHTLRKMLRGGIYDHLGGGFARYSTDDKWLVPHFEKMLYDNALLVGLLTETFQATGEPLFAAGASETIDYIRRDMTSPEGAFYATEDADSEGEEGKFYVWSVDEVKEAVADDILARVACEYYDVTSYGNFEHGKSILHVDRDADVVAATLNMSTAELLAKLEEARGKLLEARSKRVRPARDDKIIACWNGLMLDALARAAAVFGRADYLDMARKNADYLLRNLWQEASGRMVRVAGTRVNAFLEDYAAIVNGLLSLYEATFETRWFASARRVLDRMLEQFEDTENGGFYFTSSDHEQLITRLKDPFDNATPSGNSLGVMALLRMGALTGEEAYTRRAERVLRQQRDMMVKAPTGFGLLLCALDFHLSEPVEIALVFAQDGQALGHPMRQAVFTPFVPNKVVAGMRAEQGEAARHIALLDGKKLIDGQDTAYVCHHFTCDAPLTDAKALAERLAAKQP